MSGSLNNIYNNVSFALYLHTNAMAKLQEQISTGSRINRVSDDPAAAYRVLGLNSNEKSLGNYINNLSEVASILEFSSTILNNITSGLVEMQIRLTQITSGIYDEAARKRTAEGIDDILEQIVSLANTQRMNQYLFGGSDTDSAPYMIERTNGKITKVTYQGSLESRDIEVAPGLESSAFYIGDNIFRSNDRSDPIFIGDTGAKTGTGTSSVRGGVWLTVRDSGGYELSIDDGATWIAAGGVNTAVTNSLTGEVLYVDTTGITSTGVDLVSVPGTYDIFNTLIIIRDVLENEKGFSEAQVRELLNNLPSSVEEISKVLVQAQVSIGSKIGFLDGLKYSLKGLKYDTEDEATRLQEADIAQIVIDLSRREVLYQMSLAVAARLMSMSLLDFI
ncbi:MAG: flagellar hook-associated protein FlgL [Planctomycetes bacterium]|nr:flagellar hook-associated protein FlgL [Planctomycetota bacterium]MCH8118450.1 flagellar hook-associated protein FlgL [Planctomycetota bacterium]